MAMNTLKRIVLSKTFIICVGILVLYTLAGFFLAPFLVRHYVPKIVEEKLQKKADNRRGAHQSVHLHL